MSQRGPQERASSGDSPEPCCGPSAGAGPAGRTGQHAHPVSEAFHRWIRCCSAAGWRPRLPAEDVLITAAVGRVTAAPIRARWSSPAHDLAAMDGIAVRAADLAGATATGPVRLSPEAFCAVDTGDPLPAAHDAVVMREDVTYLPDGSVELISPVRPLRHVRTVGEDVMAGELLLPSGHELRPVDVAVAAGAGHLTLPVRRRPRVAVLPTGDEVRPLGTEIGRGEILDTNSLMLSAMIREAGCTPVCLPITRDDRDALATAIRAAAGEADLVLVLAGSSAGRDDHTATVLADLGEIAVHGVAMRPGHPVVLGVVRAHTPVPVIGVPGYPVSTAHVFDLLACPFLHLVQGSEPRARPALRATLVRAVTSRAGSDERLAVRLDRSPVDGSLLAEPITRGAGALSVLMRADGLLRIPAESTGIDAGTEVLVEHIPGAPGPPTDDAEAFAAIAPATTAAAARPGGRSGRRLAARS